MKGEPLRGAPREKRFALWSCRRLATRWAVHAVVVGAVVVFCAWSSMAHAERLAVVVGNNQGQRGETPLSFAEDDAMRMADALVAVGGFAASDVGVLRGTNATEARRSILSMNERLRQTPAPDSMLVVYYSGHSDAQALHLGTSELPLRELELLVRSSSARFRVLIVDSCRSGVLTRTKGGRSVAPIDIQIHGEGDADDEGLVILTSAAAGEDAQESDRLQGSFFTHHLVSALLGAADDDDNDIVTLAELYRYAYEHTLRDSSQTAVGVQHPGYRYDLRGSGDIAVARLGSSSSWGLLRVPQDVDVLLFAGDRAGRVVAEFRRDTRRGGVLAVRPGRYFVRARGERVLFEGVVVVDVDAPRVLDLTRLERVEYARLARKGGAAGPGVSLGPHAAGFARGSLTGSTPCLGGVLGVDVAVGPLLLAPRVGGCRESFSHDVLAATTTELQVSLGIDYVFDLPWGLAVSAGPEFGGTYLQQTFDADIAVAPDNRLGGPLVGAHTTVGWHLPWGFVPTASVFARTYVLPVERDVNRSELAALFALGATVGLTRYF
jgi:hypothetical protein